MDSWKNVLSPRRIFVRSVGEEEAASELGLTDGVSIVAGERAWTAR